MTRMNMDIGRIKNRVAVVTGGSSGIGQAVAIALGRAGASVVVVGRNTRRIGDTLSRVRSEGWGNAPGWQAIGLELDVRKDHDMEEMARRVISEFGRIDILVAAAGSGGSSAMARRLPYAVVQMPVEEWDEVVDTNLKGIFFSNRAVLPPMMRQGGGDIINVSSSRGARQGLPYAAAYSASKHGVMGLSESLAEEMCSYGIRVQVVLPDVTETGMMHAAGNLAPHGLLKPETVADLILNMLALPCDTMLEHPLIAPFPASEAPGKTVTGTFKKGV